MPMNILRMVAWLYKGNFSDTIKFFMLTIDNKGSKWAHKVCFTFLVTFSAHHFSYRCLLKGLKHFFSKNTPSSANFVIFMNLKIF